MPSHPLTTFEIQKYYQNELKLNGLYSRNKRWGISNKSWWVWIDKNSLEWCECVCMLKMKHTLIVLELNIFRKKLESLLEYTNLFSPNKYKRNDKMILKYF